MYAWHTYYLRYSIDALAHASERDSVFSTIIQAGRVGIMTNSTLLMEDIRLLSPTYLTSTPRHGTLFLLV